jgi:SAM-dependent methyltransferase
MTFPESKLAHRYLDNLKGIEIGGSAHNPFGLNSWNVCNCYMRDWFNEHQVHQCGRVARIDVTAEGDELPFGDSSLDYVISSHVLEHFYDPIKALREWWRVVRSGGYIIAIVPHIDRTFDKGHPRTLLTDLIDRNRHPRPRQHEAVHYSFWYPSDTVELIGWLGWDLVEVQDKDDKAGNGFCVVVKVQK